jgi:hypothetical protein
MDNHSLSTNQASKMLQKDLCLHYGVGKNVVSHFFNLVQETSNGNYWEQKDNYHFLIKENESIDEVKGRIKSKVNKFWFNNKKNKDAEKINNGLEILLSEKKDRKSLYMKAQRLKYKRDGSRLPNPVLLHLLVSELGHYDQIHRGVHS